MSKIKITFPDGAVKEFDNGITGYQIAQSISSRLADEVLAVKFNDAIKDLHRAIEGDGTVKFLTFDDVEGKEVYWHSSSHLMAHAVQDIFPEAKFGVGPAIEAGFYYDIDINTQLSEDHLKQIEDKMLALSKTDTRFEREELSQQDAIEYFKKKGDQYKVELLSEMDETKEKISIYKEGSFTDLCRGPHLPNPGKIKFVKLLNISGSYWRGDEKNKQFKEFME